MQRLNSRRALLAGAVLACSALAGCATPDLRTFATETASLGAAITTEQSEVLGHFDLVTSKIEERDKSDPDAATLRKQRAEYERNAKAIDAVMDAAVAYSAALADLAAAGDTGPAAVDSLTGTLKGFGDAVGAAFPIAAIPTWAVDLIKEVADGVTRIQAQRTLADATKAADPTVKKIADALATLYRWDDKGQGPQAAIVTGLQKREEGALRDSMGANRIAFYRGLNVDLVSIPGEEGKKTRLEWFFGDIDDKVAKLKASAGICSLPNKPGPDPHCFTGETAQGLQAIVDLSAGIEPQYTAFVGDVAASKRWLALRKAASGPIAGGAEAWAAEHAKVSARLEECGGFRALQKSCGSLTSANFKQTVERVKAVAGKQ